MPGSFHSCRSRGWWKVVVAVKTVVAAVSLSVSANSPALDTRGDDAGRGYRARGDLLETGVHSVEPLERDRFPQSHLCGEMAVDAAGDTRTNPKIEGRLTRE